MEKIMACGTGRCGTQSFAKMFNLKHGTYVSPHNIYLAPHNPDIKFVCLQRDREECVKSLVQNAGFTQQRAYQYYDLYYTLAYEYELRLDNFKIFDTEELNYPERIENFLGVKAKMVEPVTNLCQWCYE